MVPVEYGDEVTAVRLVPLADGRVVLVTGDDASFFDALMTRRRTRPSSCHTQDEPWPPT